MKNDSDEKLTMTLKNKNEVWAIGGQQMLSILEEPLFNMTIEPNQNPHQGRRCQFFCFSRR
jgi:hypothetical protein